MKFLSFADDTKLSDIRSIQRAREKLVAWTNRWHMSFSVNKCGVMGIGKRHI